ncbi:hypothetical protein Premu_1220 [Hallella multisaccharivorax DSM 17128]|uniref:Uncharacterized protein n=1 Tax=Hallella multisaccharivorax DSM 17128 TaxID=688246 RepID=F8N971_9BACT|nr:hypothetical protein Premu_1220 [Hallella multisaccharivorax DSM 17128]
MNSVESLKNLAGIFQEEFQKISDDPHPVEHKLGGEVWYE